MIPPLPASFIPSGKRDIVIRPWDAPGSPDARISSRPVFDSRRGVRRRGGPYSSVLSKTDSVKKYDILLVWDEKYYQ